MAENSNSEENHPSEEIQEFINGIVSESVHYGWLNYGEDASVLEEYPALKKLAEKAHKQAQKLDELNDLFLEEMEELGYETEY